MTSAIPAGNRVRELRLKLGLTQGELASRAGVSRPSITAIESGRITPSVTAAVAIARALGATVEATFAATETLSPEWAWSPPRAAWRAWQAEVAEKPLLVPVEGIASASTVHDVVASNEPDRAFDWRLARSTLVVASCDPAAGQMAAEYHALTGQRMIVVRRSSRQALELLRQGKVHVAGMHLATHGRRGTNAEIARDMLGNGYGIVRGASWKAGVATSGRLESASVRRLSVGGVRWVGRETGSGARQCLDEILGTERTYRHLARDHAGVVEAIRSGWADAGVCIELTSLEAGLAFRSVRTEDYDLVFAEASGGDPRIRGLLQLLESPRYRQIVGELPGYNSDETGQQAVI
ncbi:MAG TPA: substrate-binding domain-containing protein [Caulifigura sp.]|jgi:molybdate-binding protein/DNA-binding XRE family transcriptional regulator|nr:substrate-binding domain-containing protein [Caulifigura sp.]